MVKSFVLMLDLHFDDLVRQLVEVLLDSARCSLLLARMSSWE
jgi:hypothetical protein